MSILTCPPLHSIPAPASWPTVPSTPPASLNLFAPPERFASTKSAAEYALCLDRTDRIIHTSNTWDQFAPSACRRRLVLGRSMEWFVADDTVRECFRMLLERVRKQDRTARIISRCDHGLRARAVQLTFMPVRAGEVEVVWTLLRGEAAESVPVVSRRRFHDGEFLRMCSWCRDVHMRTNWQRLDAAAASLGLLDHEPLPPITHGICPACSAALSAENAERQALPIAV